MQLLQTASQFSISNYIWPAIFLVILLFILSRELWTWYWKINRMVKLLEQIEKNTRSKQPSNTLQ